MTTLFYKIVVIIGFILVKKLVLVFAKKHFPKLLNTFRDFAKIQKPHPNQQKSKKSPGTPRTSGSSGSSGLPESSGSPGTSSSSGMPRQTGQSGSPGSSRSPDSLGLHKSSEPFEPFELSNLSGFHQKPQSWNFEHIKNSKASGYEKKNDISQKDFPSLSRNNITLQTKSKAIITHTQKEVIKPVSSKKSTPPKQSTWVSKVSQKQPLSIVSYCPNGNTCTNSRCIYKHPNVCAFYNNKGCVHGIKCKFYHRDLDVKSSQQEEQQPLEKNTVNPKSKSLATLTPLSLQLSNKYAVLDDDNLDKLQDEEPDDEVPEKPDDEVPEEPDDKELEEETVEEWLEWQQWQDWQDEENKKLDKCCGYQNKDEDDSTTQSSYGKTQHMSLLDILKNIKQTLQK